MAILNDQKAAQQHQLSPQTLIGRSRSSTLRIDSLRVSGQHALLRWTGEAWELRDLGSRNGTFVNSRRLPPGERVQLSADDTIGFGEDDRRWHLLDDSPPHASARPTDGVGPTVTSEGGLLLLPPEAELPVVSIFRDAQGDWVCEQDEQIIEATDTIEVEGRTWQLMLPEAAVETLQTSARSVHSARMHFEVSQDEEFARMTIQYLDESVPLQPRVHHYLLLTLARIRLEQQQGDPDNPDASGWVHILDLAKMLRIGERQINLQVFRARKQIAEAGIEDAAAIVERRPSSRQLRIGVADLTIATIQSSSSSPPPPPPVFLSLHSLPWQVKQLGPALPVSARDACSVAGS